MTGMETMLAHKNGADRQYFEREVEHRLRCEYSEADEKNILRNMLTDGEGVARYLAHLDGIRRAVLSEMTGVIGEVPAVGYTGAESKAGMMHRVDAVEAAASVAFVTMAERGEIDGVTASEHASLFAPWAENVSYEAGALRVYGGRLFRCLQAHRSQADWTPEAASALWTAVSDPAEEYPAWSAPVGAHDAYGVGDTVTHGGARWRSLSDGNVWEPGVYGWEAVI